mgnify:CR=1 FL=1
MQNKKTPDFKIVGKLRSDVINLNDEIEGTFMLGVYIITLSTRETLVNSIGSRLRCKIN